VGTIKVNGDFTAVTNRGGWDGDTRIVFSGFKIVAKDSGVNAHLIDFKNVTHSLIENIYIDGKSPKEGKAGILFRGSTTPEGFSYGNRISKCTVCNCGYGIFLSTNAVKNIVEGCNLFYNHTNLYLINAPRNEVIGNICHASKPYGSQITGHDGILVDNSSECVIQGNLCEGNCEHGIYISTGSQECTVVGNNCQRNEYCGIQLNGSQDNPVKWCTLTGNVCSKNGSSATNHGIYVGYWAQGNTINSNTCYGNKGYGILETDNTNGAWCNVIVGNICWNNEAGQEGQQIIIGSGTDTIKEHNQEKESQS